MNAECKFTSSTKSLFSTSKVLFFLKACVRSSDSFSISLCTVSLSLIMREYSCIAAFLSSVSLFRSLLAFILTAIAWFISFTASSCCCWTLARASLYSFLSRRAISHWRIAEVHCCFKPLRSRIAELRSWATSSHCFFKRATSSCKTHKTKIKNGKILFYSGYIKTSIKPLLWYTAFTT